MDETALIENLFLRQILEQPDRLKWTVQGFGFIRTYLDEKKRWRLNIWDDRLQVPNVSTIHDHPWDFTSHILAGSLLNIVYQDEVSADHATHEFMRIKTGEGGGKASEIFAARLIHAQANIYKAGDDYYQPKEWVHETRYDRGTITLNDRSPPTQDYTARVYWSIGTHWIDAMPRPAFRDEIDKAVAAALELL